MSDYLHIRPFTRLPSWRLALALGLAGLASSSALAQEMSSDDTHQPHGAMLRMPDVSATQVTFVYAGDVWVAPREGGVARLLASPQGQEGHPKFSADGRTVAFMANYEGNTDLYTVPVDGGPAHRVTWHGGTEVLNDWTPDGRLLFHARGRATIGRQTQLFTVDAEGGLPTQLPVAYGAGGAISPDGRWLVYSPHTRDGRTWKRYRGGQATDLWLVRMAEDGSGVAESSQITDWEGTDTRPMWHRADIYYLSDAGPEHRLNVWRHGKDGTVEQITSFADHDVLWPSMGPGPDGQGEIVFQQGSRLMALDLGTRETREIEVHVPGDRPRLRPMIVDAAEQVDEVRPGPTGKRVVASARGDIWTLPAEHGVPRNLTRTDGVAERDPSWSPDGRWVAYTSDASGEYQLHVRAADGSGDARALTDDLTEFVYGARWSPDSKTIQFSTKSGTMYLLDVESGERRQFWKSHGGRPPAITWSHDGSWIAFADRAGENGDGLSAIRLCNVATGEVTQVTSGRFADSAPAFDRKGDFLYFASARSVERPIYGDQGATWVYAGTEVLVAAPLRADVELPYRPKRDVEEVKEDDEKAGDEGKDEGDDKGTEDEKGDESAEKAPLVIDLDGFEARTVQLPPSPGVFGGLEVADGGKLVYVRRTPRGVSGAPKVQFVDPTGDDRGEKTIVDGVGGFDLTADGKRLLFSKGGSRHLVDVKADQKPGKPVVTDGMEVRIDPRDEWAQILTDAWRIQRDFFYDPNMHGVDWPAELERHRAMLDDCASREDVSHVIRELISELNVGHAYYWGGDEERAETRSVGVFGVDWEVHGGHYRIGRIVQGAPWDLDARNPLAQAGVKEAEYVVAIEGRALTTDVSPWAFTQGLAGKTVALTIGAAADPTDTREVVVTLLGNDGGLRYRDWVERNRRQVERLSGGRVGYVHVPNTGVNGQNELVRQFHGQRHLPALMIDERWNGGGQIPNRFVELLNRPRLNYWAVRDGKDWAWPYDSHQGPKCMLVNGLAGSGGDAFPYYFRQAGLGKLVGTRTWGGLVGISGNPGLIDGGYTAVPTFAFYELDGTWGIEGHGVDPDLVVVDDPLLMNDGADPQIEAAVTHLVEELERAPYSAPDRPPYPDRGGMGITPEDR